VGLTRQSIGFQEFFLKMDCRIKPGNDEEQPDVDASYICP
jgi:hypothetical protein